MLSNQINKVEVALFNSKVFQQACVEGYLKGTRAEG